MNERKPDRAGQIFGALGKSVCYLMLFLGMQILLVLPMTVAMVMEEMGASLPEDSPLYGMANADAMALSLASNILTLIFVLLFYLIRRKKLGESLGLRRVSAPTLFAGAAIAPALYLVVSVALAALPEAWLESYSEASSMLDDELTLVSVLAVVVAAPIVEEIVFRGLMMDRLSRAMPGWLAVALSAAAFGACHGHPVWFAYAFVLGAVFGWLDLRAGSILPSILGHVVFNGIGQIISALPETEDGMMDAATIGVLLAVAVIAILLDRKAVAALFRPAPKSGPMQELPTQPGVYEYDPWDE